MFSVFFLAFFASVATVQLYAQPAASSSAPAQAQDQQQPTSTAKPAYSLPPEKLARAIAYSRIRVILDFLGSGWGILQLILLLALGVVARMRNVAVNLSRNRWAQGFIFIFCFC